MTSRHNISLRLKLRPEVVEALNNLRRTKGWSLNQAVNTTLTNALVAKGMMNDLTNQN